MNFFVLSIVWGVYEQNDIVNSVYVHDLTAKWAIIAGNVSVFRKKDGKVQFNFCVIPLWSSLSLGSSGLGLVSPSSLGPRPLSVKDPVSESLSRPNICSISCIWKVKAKVCNVNLTLYVKYSDFACLVRWYHDCSCSWITFAGLSW